LFVGGSPLDTYQPRTIVPLLEEAFRRNGIDFEARHYPSSRALVLSNSGEADGELNRVSNFHEVSKGEYPNLVRIESHLMTVHLAVFSRRNTRIDKPSDLKGFNIAYKRGRKNVEKILDGFVFEKDMQPKNSDMTAFSMLAEGRVDYVMSPSFEGQMLIQQNDKFDAIKEVGRIEEVKIYSYMHKKHSGLAETIAASLEEMKQDGTFQRIVEEVRALILAGK